MTDPANHGAPAPGSNPLNIRLQGLHLIEASAGTGKTYTIAHLVLRLVVEVDLRIDKILVLTFTDAATQELRERIARRLGEARAALGGCPTRDAVLRDWAGAVPDPRLALARLNAARADLDRAAIYTIHGFCRRILQDFAFESGTPFDAELIQDEADLRRAAAEDFWRRRLGDADPGEAAWLIAQLPKGPESLLALFGRTLGGVLPVLVGADQARVESDQRRLRDLLGLMAEAWPGVRAEVGELLRQSPALKRNIYTSGRVESAIAAMDALAGDPVGPGRRPVEAGLDWFSTRALANATKVRQTPPSHTFFDLASTLAELDPQRLEQNRRAALLAEALTTLRSDLEARKRERRVAFFDDLLTQTAAALEGPRGPALATRLRGTYPLALIDEFQDTDDLQYRIFNAIYGDALRGGESCGLALIGDPKQAIYGFRGADIFTYMAARRAAQAQGEVHSLNTNRRSTAGLVEAVNQMFARARRPFVFDTDIPFVPVQSDSGADDEPLWIRGARATPLVIRWLPLDETNADKSGRRLLADPARSAAAADCARQIAALLGEPARLGGSAAGDGGEPLGAGQIAVLVRSHRDGTLVREALGRLGVGSVSIGQERVFETEEAEDLAAILAALAPGAADGVVRSALATRSLGWCAADLARLGQDEGAWDLVLTDFTRYREIWHSDGFMAAFTALVHDQDLPRRLRAGPQGERRLTNLLQLAELTQEASQTEPGALGLCRWLAERRRDPGSSGDAALLRLESDENLVQVITYHKSKGLEYQVVFLPMPWGAPRPQVKGEPLPFHDRDTLESKLDLGSPQRDSHQTLAAEESLAEGLRLIYVALTRAKQQCILYWGPVHGAEGSALAYLLHQGPDGDGQAAAQVQRLKAMDETQWRSDLDALVRSAPGCIALEDLVAQDTRHPPPPVATPQDLAPARFGGRIPDTWRMLSFSALAWGQELERPDHDALGSDPDIPENLKTVDAASDPDQSGTPDLDPTPAAEPPDAIFRFPRGIQAGHCLHHLFEHLDFRCREPVELRRAAESALARHGIEVAWADTLTQLVTRVLDTPLTADGLRLAGIGPEDRRNELEFHFALDGFDPAALHGVLSRHGVPAGRAPMPLVTRLRGLMKGYVDLVLRANGRFYVLDYKSNHLGDHLDDYGPEGLASAMEAHGYHLQYLIYTLALHRYLRVRLPEYDYRRHQGGALYLFLRGMRPESGASRGVFHQRPSPGLIEDLDLVFGG